MFKANLILLANTGSPGKGTNFWSSLRVTICRPLAFVIGQMNLHGGKINATIYK